MAQAMLNFFDEHYFSEDCSCDLNKSSDRWRENCLIHSVTPINPNTHQQATQPTEEPTKHTHQANLNFKPTESSKISSTHRVEINQSFPRQPTFSHHQDIIEYRIKVLSLYDLVFQPGEVKQITTNLSFTRKPGKLSALLKPVDNLPLRFLGEGIVSPSYRGSLIIPLQNLTNNIICLRAETLVAYLIMSPYLYNQSDDNFPSS